MQHANPQVSFTKYQWQMHVFSMALAARVACINNKEIAPKEHITFTPNGLGKKTYSPSPFFIWIHKYEYEYEYIKQNSE